TAATEHPDVGKLVEVGQGDLFRLHAAHRQAGHGPVRLVGQRAVVRVDEGNQLVGQNLRKGGEVEPGRPAGGTATTLSRPRGGLPGGTATIRAGRAAASATTTNVSTVVHHDDERLGFTGGEAGVQDQTRVSLAAPAGLVLAGAVLEVQHRVADVGILVVVGWRVDEA